MSPSKNLRSQCSDPQRTERNFEKQEELIRVLIAQNEHTAREYQEMATKLRTVEQWVQKEASEAQVRYIAPAERSTTEDVRLGLKHAKPQDNNASKAKERHRNRHAILSDNTDNPFQPNTSSSGTLAREIRISQPDNAPPPTSAMLLQAIPWKSPGRKEGTRDERERSLRLGQRSTVEVQGSNPTDVVRMMLGKYTPEGSRLLEYFLDLKGPRYVFDARVPRRNCL